MSNRASLNHIYRTVWNQALGAMVAVAEITSVHQGSGAASRVGRLRAHPLAVSGLGALSLGIALAWGTLPIDARANPAGGVAVFGQASFSNPTPNQLNPLPPRRRKSRKSRNAWTISMTRCGPTCDR